MTVAKNTAAAKKAEVAETGLSFEFEGVTYSVPPAKEWDLDIIEAQEDNRIITSVKLLLGDQYATFKKAGKNGKRTMEDLENLLGALYAAADVDPKE